MIYIFIILGILILIVATIFITKKYSTSTIQQDIEPTRFAQESQLIPRHIYQTMKSKIVPKQMKNAIDTWIQLNPDYTYHFYDDERCRDFIKTSFPKRVLDAYDSLIPGAFKADLWRYCLLYIKGGVYVDVDMIDIVPLNKIINKNDQFITARDHDPKALFNAFICCTPKHPFMEAMIDYTVDSVETNFYGNSCLEPTGPVGFGKVLHKMLNIYSTFRIGETFSNGYSIKLLDFPLGQEHIIYNKKPCIKNKYMEYTKQLKDISKQETYYTLWLHKKIYKNKGPHN